MIWLAPGRFSITTGWPQTSARRPPSARENASVAPPGELGTTIFTGREGKAWAPAVASPAHAVAPIVGLFIAVPPADIVVAHGVLDDGEHLVAFVGVQGMARGQGPAALDLLRVAGGKALAGVVAVEADDIGHLL